MKILRYHGICAQLEPVEQQDECKIGRCDKATISTVDYDPFCNRETYGNECHAKEAGYLDH